MRSMVKDESLYCDIQNTCEPPSLPPNLNNELRMQPNRYEPDPSIKRTETNEKFRELLEELKVDATRDADTDDLTRKKKKEVYKFETDWLVSNVCWSNDGQYRLALTSFIEEYKNFVQVVQLAQDDPDEELESVFTFEHPYPATRIKWIPKQFGNNPQLLATTADYLRLWQVHEDSGARLECLMNRNQGSKLCAPLTSFDWCSDASTIVTSSVDTTCAVWDINTTAPVDSFDSSSAAAANGNLRTQLVAHENHVYDVAWSSYGSGKEVIATSSADGSVRLFDLRDLSTSSVLYENGNTLSDRLPLVRVSCSKMESNLVATFASYSSELIILDTRNPGQPLCVLNRHLDDINSMSWSSQSARSICSGADDKQALIWQISEQQEQRQTSEPILAYRASGKINSTSWAPSNVWVAIGYRNYLELLRV